MQSASDDLDQDQVAEEPRAQTQSPSNDGQLIGDLPPELFVQVLDNVYWLLRRKEMTWDTNWAVPYQLVCRRWRDVICATPQFWQDISVSSSPRWLDFCLTQCAGAPATVTVWDPASPDATFATLCRHASAIRACYIYCEVACMDVLAGVYSLLATPMPALETFLVNGLYQENDFLDVPLRHDLVPRLTSLELWNSIAPGDAALYTSLRSLTFIGTTWNISYSEILDVMRECRDLQYLRLDEEVLDLFAEELANSKLPTGDWHRPAPLVLPRLRTVLLTGRCGVLFHLLATIHVPQATKVILTINLDDDDDDDDNDQDQEPGPLLTHLLAPNPHLRLPFLSAPHAISLSCSDGDPFQLSLRGGPDGNALLSVDYGMVHNELWPGNTYLERNLVAIMDLFSDVASVDTLEVVGCLDEVAARTWQRVFEAFSGLRVLRVKGRGALDTLWLGLERATMSSLEHGGPVCCPSLSEIGIDDRLRVASRFKFAATAELHGLVCSTLRLRADVGGTPIRKLQLHLEFTEELELWSEAFVEDVRALVEELDYRDAQA